MQLLSLIILKTTLTFSVLTVLDGVIMKVFVLLGAILFC